MGRRTKIQMGNIKETKIQIKCRGETWEQADARNDYFFNQGKQEEQKRSMEVCNKCKPYQEGIVKGKNLAFIEIKRAIFQKYDCGAHYEKLCKIINELGNKK